MSVAGAKRMRGFCVLLTWRKAEGFRYYCCCHLNKWNHTSGCSNSRSMGDELMALQKKLCLCVCVFYW